MTAEPDWDRIRSDEPSVAIRSVTPLGEGWTAYAFRVDDDLVFKFPKRADEWEELDREIAFLAYARSLLPLPVAEHLYQVRESCGAPNGYAVYRHLPGNALALGNLSERGRAAVAAALAEFLRVLHDLHPPPDVLRILPREDERAVAEAYYRDARAAVMPRLTREEQERLDALFERHLTDAGNFPLEPCVLHADLSADHILSADGEVSGILDWGDVNVGDADYDFSYLYSDFGEGVVRDVAARYGHHDPDRLVRKACYFTVVDQIGTIVHGAGRAREGDEAAAWRRLRGLLRDAPKHM